MYSTHVYHNRDFVCRVLPGRSPRMALVFDALETDLKNYFISSRGADGRWVRPRASIDEVRLWMYEVCVDDFILLCCMHMCSVSRSLRVSPCYLAFLALLAHLRGACLVRYCSDNLNLATV